MHRYLIEIEYSTPHRVSTHRLSMNVDAASRVQAMHRVLDIYEPTEIIIASVTILNQEVPA